MQIILCQFEAQCFELLDIINNYNYIINTYNEPWNKNKI